MPNGSAPVLGLALVAMLAGCAGTGTTEPVSRLVHGEPLLVAAACEPLAPDAIADPYRRSGLSGWSCETDGAAYALLLVTDPNITWPVAVADGERVDMEQAILDGSGALGGGHFYVDAHRDTIEWLRRSRGQVVGVVYSVRGSDPVTGAARTGHVAVAFAPRPGAILVTQDRNSAYQAFQMQ